MSIYDTTEAWAYTCTGCCGTGWVNSPIALIGSKQCRRCNGSGKVMFASHVDIQRTLQNPSRRKSDG